MNLLDLSLSTLLIVGGVVFFGALVQGVAGFGLNLVAAPLVAVVEPRLVPASMMVVSIPLLVSMIARSHHHIDWKGVGVTAVARVPGTIVGLLVLGQLSNRALQITVGVIVLIACAVTALARWNATPTVPIAAGAGFWSGFMDTTAAVGGPPLALAYRNTEPETLRSTLAAIFSIGTVISFGALWLNHRASGIDLGRAAVLWPAVMLGALSAHRLAGRIDHTRLKALVLGLAATSGVIAIAVALTR